MDVAAGVGLATAVVLVVASAAAWLVNRAFLEFHPVAQAPVFIAVAAIIVQTMELFMRWKMPQTHRILGLYLPLIATNCAVLAVMLLAVRGAPDSPADAIAIGLGGGIGFMLAVVCFAAVRERIVESATPALMRGAPLAMISAGWMAVAFSGMLGIFR